MSEKLIVIGGGNAALCAAMEAAKRNSDVTLVEYSPKSQRGGNSKYTRDIRYTHDEDDFTSGVYEPSELEQDLLGVSGEFLNYDVAKMVIERSNGITKWMHGNGIIFKKEIRGTLNLSRTNAFFMGGGKVLVDTYYNKLEKIGVKILYNTFVNGIKVNDNLIEGISCLSNGKKIEIVGTRYVFASGGFEANKAKLTEFWGESARNIKIRGSKYNTGEPLKLLIEAGAIRVGREKSGHVVAVDDRSPEFDGGIVTRIDAIPWGLVFNNKTERFYDEGEDIWPKRYAIWGRLVADQPSQIAFVIIDSKSVGKFMPTSYPPVIANTITELANKIGLDPVKLNNQIGDYNGGIVKDSLDFFQWRAENISQRKSHWALPIDTPPYMAYPIRPGLTFTYEGIRIDATGRIIHRDGIMENAYAAGEIASGNVLSHGYLAGFGLTIGTVLGRLAGGWGND
jgi:tricarballylate dehydrogenase